MPFQSFFLWLFIQVTILPALFSQTNDQLRANLYAFDNSGNPALLDGNLTMYNLTFSNVVDDYDAVKMSNFGENFGMLRDTKTLVIERRQSITISDTIFFKMWNMHPVAYKLELVLTGLNKPGLTAVLEDLYLDTKTTLDLNGVTSSTFAVTNEAGSSEPGRFRILFSNPSLIEQAVTFTNLTAYQNNSDVEVEWQVGNQKNIVQYDIEKSYDGVKFIKAKAIAAIVKNSSNVYRWLDVNPSMGSLYYRIRSVSESDSFIYSDTVMVKTFKTGSGAGVYPNPVHKGSTVSIDFTNRTAGKYDLKLINNFGGTVLVKTINHVSGTLLENFKLNNISSGIYLLQIGASGKQPFTAKVIIE